MLLFPYAKVASIETDASKNTKLGRSSEVGICPNHRMATFGTASFDCYKSKN